MITILHGDNIVASRNRLHELRQENKGKEIVSFATVPDKTSLVQALESQSLFGGERVVTAENILAGLGRKTKDDLLAYLTSGKFDTDCILWEPKIISKTTLASFPKSTHVELFKLTTALFKFLESIAPNNAGEMLQYFHESLPREGAELIFSMLIRQVRLLLAIATDAQGLDELNRLVPWQESKLRQQAAKFTIADLLELHQRLYSIDYEQKLGKNVLVLEDTLDILLTEI